MKIAVFTDTYFPKVDGIVTSIMNSTKGLAKKGHEIVIFAPKYKKKEKLTLPKNIKVYRSFSFSLSSYKGVKVPVPNLIKLIKRFNKFKPDIIHIHAPGTMGMLGILFSKMFNVPSIGTYHTLVSEQITYLSLKRLTRFDKLIDKIKSSKINNNKNQKEKIVKKEKNNSIFKSETLKKIIDIISLKKIRKNNIGKELVWRITCNLYNKCNVVTVPSKSIKKELIKYGVTKPILVLSNGINLETFSPKNNYKSDKKLKLLHVGRISFEKEIDVVIKAYKKALKENNKISLKIVGDGPALKNLKILSKELGLKEKIEFTGCLLGKELVESYKQSDIFVTTSTMETQGMVILEAMSCGLPVIGVDKFAIPDLVSDGINGFIVKSGDSNKIKDKILEVAKDNKLLEKFGKKSVELAKKHELNNVINQLEEIYSKTIKSIKE